METAAAHRRYVALLVGLAVAVVLAAGLFGRSLEPLTGDLTRIGWYAENDYGWTRPQARFDPPLAPEGKLDGAYDVVVIGDSFSVDEATHQSGVAWPHWLARDTGLRVGVFDSGIDPPEKVLAAPVFRERPPAILVYEIVERSLVPTHGHGRAPCRATTAAPQPRLATRPLAAVPAEVQRRRAWGLLEWPASYGMNFAVEATLRRLRGAAPGGAVAMEMTRGGLFSSRFDRGLLVYGEDFNKMGWQDAAWDAAGCDLLALQDRVQANGRTQFLAVLVPDKLSIYARFLPYRDFDGLSRRGRLRATPGLALADLDGVLDPGAAVDLYLPDDTHWSSATHAAAARRIGAELAARGGLAPP